MIGLFASIVDGLLVGSVYGLAAMGISLIWGVMDVINLTHGAMIVAGMFGLYLMVNDLGIPVYATLPPVLIGGLMVGVMLYWIAVHRMIGRPPLMSLLSTFSVNLVLIGLGTAEWGTVLFNVPVSLPGFSIGRYTFPGAHIMAAVLTAAIAGLLYLFLFHTRPGKAVRAVSGNREAAELVGIPTTRVLAFAFGLGVALACVSGMLIGTLFPFTVLSGDAYQLKSFVVTVLGGLGNPAGALIGGLALGLFEGLTTPFMPVSWTLVFEFVLFVVVLIAFPGGLLNLRLRGAYFALATIGVNEAVQAFVTNFEPWGGGTGIYLSTELFQPLGGPAHALWIIYYILVGVMGLSLYLSYFIKTSKFGLGLLAIGQNEDAAAVLGVPTPRYKAMVYCVSAFLPAVAGGLYFFKGAFIQPIDAFDLQFSTEAIVIAMLGGQGTVMGPALGAFIYEQLRGWLLTSDTFANFQLVIAGALLLVIVIFAPGGLMGWLYGRWPRLKKVLE